jgi:hypothetical protein
MKKELLLKKTSEKIQRHWQHWAQKTEDEDKNAQHRKQKR